MHQEKAITDIGLWTDMEIVYITLNSYIFYTSAVLSFTDTKIIPILDT